MFVTIEDAITWVTMRRHKNKGLLNFCKALRSCGSPQDTFKTIHVAGTNGKGSTVTYIKDILMEANYRVGTFTSPHLIKHQDRIRYQGEWISDIDFLAILNEHEELIIKYELNMFEIDMLIASVYFRNKHVDFAIIEVGLGGRLDCTNCLTRPELTIITSIGLDHVELLGDTVEKIAIEKAGIIKQGVPCLLGKLKTTCVDEIKAIALEKHSDLIYTLDFEKIDNYHFSIKGKKYFNRSGATYQMKNAAVAISAINFLSDKKIIDVSDNQIKYGIENSRWEGRFETISENPRIIVDGAHNDEGIRELIESLQELQKPLVIVFSALRDKPTENMISQLHQVASTLIVTEFNYYRVEKAKNLVYFDELLCMPDYQKAVQFGVDKIKTEGTLIICGSLYFVSEVRAYLLSRKKVSYE